MAYIEGRNRGQSTFFPERIDDYVTEENPVRLLDYFVDQLELQRYKFKRARPKHTGRPGYDPGLMVKLYIYGYLNRIQSSR